MATMIKKTLNCWALAHISGTPREGLENYAIVWDDGVESGQTTAIAAVDRGNRLIKTETGSVYKLGLPALGGAIRNRELMEKLGIF